MFAERKALRREDRRGKERNTRQNGVMGHSWRKGFWGSVTEALLDRPRQGSARKRKLQLLGVVLLVAFISAAGGLSLVRISSGRSTERAEAPSDGEVSRLRADGVPSAQRLAYGDTLPDFHLPTLAGSTLTNAYLRGHPAVVTFLPFDSVNTQDAPNQLLEALYPFLDNLRILVVLAWDANHPANIPADTALVGNPVPVVWGSRAVLWRKFRIPWFSCSYVLVVDPKGVVRLAAPYVSAADLRTVIQRYR